MRRGLREVRIQAKDRREVEAGRCLFCAATLRGKHSNEHVVPLWLQERLGVEGLYQLEHYSSSLEVLSRRVHPLKQWVEGRVCSRCNSGWMSRLEKRAMSVIGDILDGGSSVEMLSDEERVILSRWALKTAFVLNTSSNYPTNVPLRHARHLAWKDYTLPRGVYVLGGRSEDAVKFEWMQGSMMSIYPGIHREGDAEAERMLEETYRIGLHLGRLLLMVTWLPDQAWRLITAHEVHRILWPLRYKCLVMPKPPAALMRHPLMAFMGSAWVAHRKGNLGTPLA